MSGNNSCRVINKDFTKIVQLQQTMPPDGKDDKDLFNKLLDGDFDINYKVPSGNTSFQTDHMEGLTIFQLVHTDIDRCKALLDHGADFTVTDKKGSTVLLKGTTTYKYKYYLDYTDCNISYVNLILSAHISSNNVKNPKDENGLGHFHIACMYNRADTAKFFLENGVPIKETTKEDAKFYPGFSALHFAVTSGALETVELLLKSGADMFAQDTKGMNPLHVLIVDRRKTLIKLQRFLRLPPTNRENCLRTRIQEHCNINLKIINLFLERMNELGYTVDKIGFSYFHVLCFLGNTSEIQQFLDNNTDALGQCVNVDSSVWPGYTPLHFAAHSNVEAVELLLKQGADLCAKDANGLTPFEICLKEFSIEDVHRILLLQPNIYNITFSNTKTKLGDFIHAMQDSATFETFLDINLCKPYPNRFIPLDSPLCAGFTALHLVVVCAEQPMNWDSKSYDVEYMLLADMASEKSQNYLSRIESCVRYSPDVTSSDARGSTPLHWAFKLQQIRAVQMLLEQHESNSNPIDQHGLSHLHIACTVNNQVMVKSLLASGANANDVTTSCYFWTNTTMNGLLGRQCVKKYFVNKCSTPLHFATKALYPEIIEELINHGADVLAQDVDGFNPLERLIEVEIFRDCQKRPRRLGSFNEPELQTIKLLLKRIGDKLANANPKQMLYSYNYFGDDLVFDMLTEGDDASVTKILKSVGVTPLHVACFTRNLERVNELADKIDVNARVDLESPLWAGCTPLHLFTMNSLSRNAMDDNPTNRAILEKLLQSGADLTAVNAKGDTPIHPSFRTNLLFLRGIIEHLTDFSVNPMGKAGHTHLHIASAYGASTIVEKLLEHGAEVDYTADYFIEDFSGFTALHFAAYYHRKDVVDVLLKYGADVNKKNGYGGNPLHTANGEDRPAECLQLLQALISAGADINLKDMYGKTPLEALLKTSNSTKQEIELFLSPHSTFHTFNFMTDEGFLAIALNRRLQLPVYDMAINTFGMKEIDVNGRNVIHNIVSFKKPDLDGNIFDEEGDVIDEEYTPAEEYIIELRSLMKLGLSIDLQDSKGFTPLHLAARMQNLTGIIGLLENGADINVADSNGKPAFAYSFELAKANEEYDFETRRKEIKELDRRIFKSILTHVYKLNLTGILISESTREAAAKMREIQSYDTSRIEKCMNEIEEMKEQQIASTSVTFYEFLSDTGAVSNFPYFLSRQQTAIGNTFENEVEVMREVFPEMTGILLWQYRKALARCDVIDSATSSLKFLVNFSIPPNILKIILRFCTIDELNNLISSTAAE